MNSSKGGTVTTINSRNSLSPVAISESCTGLVIEGVLPGRAEANPVARKRRLLEQETSQTSKAPRRGCLISGEDDSHSPACSESVLEKDGRVSGKPPMHPDPPKKRQEILTKRDESVRLRKTIQWLEDGARQLREDLAAARSELYEERKASKLVKREIDNHIREAQSLEAAKHQKTITELKLRLSQLPSSGLIQLHNARSEIVKKENHKREIITGRKSLVEADKTIEKLRSNSLDGSSGGGGYCSTGSNTKKRRILHRPSYDLQKTDNELRCLRETNKKLEDKLLQIITEAEKARVIELRVEYEKHEAEICALKKAQRTDIIKMMEELRSKERYIEKLEKLSKRKWRAREDELMKKLRESERGHDARLGPRIGDKINRHENSEICKKNTYDVVGEIDRLRELALEQQEVIDYLHQALKERERKLDQLSNKKRKEEFYKQWLELEPVAEVDNEEEHEEDSVLSSGPSSLSPQPQQNGVSRDTYEALLLEFEELQSKHRDDQEELNYLKIQVRDLEKALLQETRGSQNSRRALNNKLRETEDRELSLLAEISELKEQNELLEFRVLELEESRESPDNVDSGIVSPEPIQLFKEQNKQHRAIATVIPYSSYCQSLSPVPAHKPPLSLQESGIFEQDDDHSIELSTCGTQTDTPAGDLLQEVQKLQELREKIQERTVKVPGPFDNSEIDDNRLCSLKERIRELEERLGTFETAELKRSNNEIIAKQREEELLDENYRLTERVYWLENKLHNVQQQQQQQQQKSNVNNMATMTEALITKECGVETEFSQWETSIFKGINTEMLCRNFFHEDLYKNLNNSQLFFIANNKIGSESIMAPQLVNYDNHLEKCQLYDLLKRDDEMTFQMQLIQAHCGRVEQLQKEEENETFMKTLKQLDDNKKIDGGTFINEKLVGKSDQTEEAICNHVCQDTSTNVDEINNMGEAKNTAEMSMQTDDELMEIDDNRDSQFTQIANLSESIDNEHVIENISSTRFAEVCETDDSKSATPIAAVSRIQLSPDEPTITPENGQSVELINESDKKVRKFQNCRRERDGWAMRVWNAPIRDNCSSVKGIRAIVRGQRFVLYQEICV